MSEADDMEAVEASANESQAIQKQLSLLPMNSRRLTNARLWKIGHVMAPTTECTGRSTPTDDRG